MRGPQIQETSGFGRSGWLWTAFRIGVGFADPPVLDFSDL